MNPESVVSPEQPRIRKVSPDEWRAFKKIRLEGLCADPSAFGSSYEREASGDESYWRDKLSDPAKSFFVVEENGRPVAMGGYKKISVEEAMVVSVYTTPKARGRGLSKLLMSRILEEIQRERVVSILLMVNADQVEAVGMYHKLGFETIEIKEKEMMGDGSVHDVYVMELRKM